MIMKIVFSFYGIKHFRGWPLTMNDRSNKAANAKR